MSDGTCKAEPAEPQRAILRELECLTDNVNGLESHTTRLAERLQKGSMPPSPAEDTASERPPHACPIAETITQLSERVAFVRNRRDDLFARVQL